MMLPLKHVFVFIFVGLCFQVTLGSFISSASSTGELSASSSNDSWTCSCTSGGYGTEAYPVGANCSAFCNCKPGEVANVNGVKSWTCICASDGVARPIHINNAGCFSSCNCTFSKVLDHEGVTFTEGQQTCAKELTDPLLKVKFPEVEVLVMSQLARECLNFDPELRPTMAEVVQIVSTITPDKRTRNFSLQFMQGSWNDKELRGYGSDSGRTEKQESQVIRDTSVLGVNAELHGDSHQWTGFRPDLQLPELAVH